MHYETMKDVWDNMHAIHEEDNIVKEWNFSSGKPTSNISLKWLMHHKKKLVTYQNMSLAMKQSSSYQMEL